MTSYNFSQVRGKKTFSSSDQIQFVLFMQTGLRSFYFAPTRKKLFSLTLLQAFPLRHTDKMIWNATFSNWFHRDFCRRVFSSAMWVVWYHWNQIFFSKKPLTTTRAVVKWDIRSKGWNTLYLGLVLVIQCSCLQLLTTLWQTFFQSELEGPLDNPLPARSLLFLILLPVKIILLDLISCSPLHILDTFKEIPSWTSAFENIFFFFREIYASCFTANTAPLSDVCRNLSCILIQNQQ